MTPQPDRAEQRAQLLAALFLLAVLLLAAVEWVVRLRAYWAVGGVS